MSRRNTTPTPTRGTVKSAIILASIPPQEGGYTSPRDAHIISVSSMDMMLLILLALANLSLAAWVYLYHGTRLLLAHRAAPDGRPQPMRGFKQPSIRCRLGPCPQRSRDTCSDAAAIAFTGLQRPVPRLAGGRFQHRRHCRGRASGGSRPGNGKAVERGHGRPLDARLDGQALGPSARSPSCVDSATGISPVRGCRYRSGSRRAPSIGQESRG